jgi:hypothetical protein
VLLAAIKTVAQLSAGLVSKHAVKALLLLLLLLLPAHRVSMAVGLMLVRAEAIVAVTVTAAAAAAKAEMTRHMTTSNEVMMTLKMT